MNSDVIKMRQRWVKDHPVRTVEELGLTGYVFDLEARGGLIVRTVLSIDLFAQPLAWRAQIGLLYPSRLPRRRADWSIEENVTAFEVAKRLLAGVGDGSQEFLNIDAMSFELCHPLTPNEIEYVLRAAGRPNVRFESVVVGEIAEYDFADRSTQIDGWWNGKTGREDGLYLPQRRILIHEPGPGTDQ